MSLTIDILLLFIIIFILTIVQSVFGVGLLLFGTPTLLLLDYSFIETLSCLTPCSIMVSSLQVHSKWNQIKLYRFNVFYYLLPMVVIGLLIILYIPVINIYLIIGLMLLLNSFVRLLPSLNESIGNFLAKNFKIGMAIIGLIHGLTNLGGAPLVAITNSIFNKKITIQSNIAYAYLTMALVQVLILIITDEFIFNVIVLFLPFFSGLVYFSVGKYAFDNINELFYKNLMTFFILLYGLFMIYNSF